MNLDTQFVTYEIAYLLKEKGFVEPCFGWRFIDNSSSFTHIGPTYTRLHLPIPLWQQAISYIEERLRVCFYVAYNENSGKWGYKFYSQDEREDILCSDDDETTRLFGFGTHETREAATISGILKAIDLL